VSTNCPSCGSEMEFTERAVVLRTGTCPSCAKEFAYVEGTTLTGHLPEVGDEPAATSVGAPVVVAEDAPECAECGAPLSFRAGRGGAVLAICSDCETTTVLRPEGETGEERPRADRRAPRSFAPEGGPRSRPCRRCGAPLRFENDEDGNLVGVCDACGNRFTLPPRDGPGGPGRGDRRPGRPPYGRPKYGGGRYSSRGGSRPYYSDRGAGRSRSGPARRRGPSEGDEDDRRRRRRRED